MDDIRPLEVIGLTCGRSQNIHRIGLALKDSNYSLVIFIA